MGRRGRKRQLGTEDEYRSLILGGVDTVEACRRVGIGRKTGYRWRSERGGSPPERVAEAVQGKRYLSYFERQHIATLRDQGIGVRGIARRLERSPSTISRELRRNTAGHDGDIYDSDLAHARARERASRRRARPIRGTHEAHRYTSPAVNGAVLPRLSILHRPGSDDHGGCNPAHLCVGRAVDNARDRARPERRHALRLRRLA